MSEPDVVVIGSGAGGSPVAFRLAESGARVLVLERGPRYERKQFVHDEIAIARRNFFMPSPDTDPHMVLASRGAEPERTNEGWVSSCVGGGTVHMSGFFYRFQPVDFRLRELLGNVSGAEISDWPISYETLAPYYDRVEELIGVSGPASEGPFGPPRSKPYPLPKLATHPLGKKLDEVAQKLGITTFDTPRAIVSQPYRGRQGCVYCQLCGGFGCEVGAKSSTLETLLPDAERTGKCEIVAGARVTEIRTDDDGRAVSVIYSKDNETHEVKARAVVVACSAIESARLLLLSTSKRFPHGLGNDEGQLGRHLMFSTLSKAHAVFTRGKHAKELLDDPSPFVGRSVLDYYAPKKAAVSKGGALNFLLPSGGPIFQSEMVADMHGDKPLFGRALAERIQRYWFEERQLDCETFGEYLPTPGTHVTLDPDVKDAAGLPVARISIDRHPRDLEVSRFLADRAVEVLDATGADRVYTSNLGGRTMHLPMGCLRMGNDSKSAAVDADCRVFGSKNVFVTDGSVFSSSGGVPPTMTILANSLRVADRIVTGLQNREL